MSILFGTDGIRGTIGVPPFTTNNTVRLGSAIGSWIESTYGPHAQIIIAHDTRQSADWLTNALCAGLLLSPIKIHLAGVLPTPAISHLLKENSQFDCGIILSASHNPYQDNGIKMVDRTYGKITPEQEKAICAYYENGSKQPGTTFGSVVSFEHASEHYSTALLKQFNTLSLKGRTVVLDCANGATSTVAPQMFSALGAQVISIHAKPNGININEQCGALHPRYLQKAVIEHAADFGCAFDGDGDRVMIVSKDGQIKNGDDMLALLSEHPAYTAQRTLVGTVMSNQGLEQYLKSHSKKLIRTDVGDRWVGEQLKKNNLLFGGEQSGHVILQDILPTGDGIATALRILESITHSHNWDMKTFDRYPQKLINIPVVHKKDLKEPPIAAIIAEYETQLDSGRIHVRYSGTENLLRVMVEDREDDATHRLCDHLAKALEKELQ
jgi:phosphoglucosamine mutase